MSGRAISCSVVIPCYNAARFLPETIGSLIGQTRAPVEIVVVDDGSTDDSAGVAANLGGLVRVLRQRNQGESVARNVGLGAATGDYVLFLDADDVLAPQSIERLTDAVSTAPGAVAVMGVAYFTEDPARPFERQVPEYPGFFPAIVQTNFGPPHCWFTPRSLALQVGGFREDLVHSEDWEFWGRIALTGARLVSVPYEGALYRRHPQSQVATAPKASILRGRLQVAEVLAAGLLRQPGLLERAGEQMFWSLWAMLVQARRGGVASSQLQCAERLLHQLARKGPTSLRRTPSAMAIRCVGVRAAERLRALSPTTK